MTVSQVWVLRYTFPDKDTGQKLRDINLDIPQCWPMPRSTGVQLTPECAGPPREEDAEPGVADNLDATRDSPHSRVIDDTPS